MHRILLLLVLFFLEKTVSAQYVYTIKADSVKITNSCDTAELIVENHTQNVPGFLFNKGRGRTEFRKGLVKLNDSSYRIGADTLKIPKPPVITASEGLSMVGNTVQLGAPSGVYGPGLFTGNRMIALNGKELRFADGSLFLTRQITGPSASSNYLMINLHTSNSENSNYIVRAYGSSLRYEYYDYTRSEAYLGISSNNISSGNPDVFYGGGGIINLQGYYGQSAGTGGMVSGIYDGSQYAPTGTGGNVSYCSHRIQPSIAGSSTGTVRGIYYGLAGSGSIPNNNNIAFENYNGNLLLNNQAGEAGGRTAIHRGIGNAPTAWLHLGAGLATVNAAPLKFTTGTVLTTPEDGAVEYDGTDLYLTTSSIRYKLSKTLTGQLSTNFGVSSLTAWNAVTTTLSVPGAQEGDVVMVNANSGAVNPSSIIITAYVTSANTVTLKAYNASAMPVSIASDTYKVRVIK
jgi:hypothetical protein